MFLFSSCSCLLSGLTSVRRGTGDGSVTDGSITGMNVHEGFAGHSHEHPLLQTQLWKICFKPVTSFGPFGKSKCVLALLFSPRPWAAWSHRILSRSAVQAFFPSMLEALNVYVSSRFLLRNQISKHKALMLEWCVIPMSLVWERKYKDPSETPEVLQRWRVNAPRVLSRANVRADLERLFVDVNVVASVRLLGLAKEDEIFKKKDTPHALLLPVEDCELVLANQLTLLF